MDISQFSLSRVNLSQQIADHLEEVILSSPTSKVAEKLPGELKLAKQYNVSRPVIREALKLLQERGLITLKNGSGAYITRPENDTVMNAINRIMQVDRIKSDDLTQMREILELSSVDRAVQCITDEQLREM
ncbi:MAG: GntR family transcriptional regulator, partial [Sphaerochaeta sp.]